MRFAFLILALSITASAHALTLPDASTTVAPIITHGTETPTTPVAENAGTAAQALIERLGKTAMAAIADTAQSDAQKKATFRTLLSQNFDLATIGRFAAGKYWRQATPAQQQEYLRLYQNMIINVYTARFNNYSGQVFSVTGNRMDESGDAVVTSTVSGKGTPVSVDWRVRNKSGAPKIIDVMVEGVSMGVTQRNDFAGVIAQGGGTFDALIAYLKSGGTSDVKE